jgi:hypothetical protein
MINKDNILGKLTPYGRKRILIKNDQGVTDIISAMLSAHEIYKNDYDKISKDFYTGDPIQTAKNIFQFLKKNISYKIESENNQRIMSPSAIISLGKNDCKNYALFIMGVLDSLKRKGIIKNKIYFRFASYKLLDEIPHHVFAVIQDIDGTEYFIDPVLPTFNDRKTYYHKIDKTPKMPLYSISGTSSNRQVGLFRKKQPAPVTTTTTKTTIVPAPKEKKKIVLKIALAPARGSFLLLVGLNFMGLATKIDAAFKKSADATQNFWKNLGGNPNELLRKTNQGAKKKRILGDDYYFPSEGQIGVVAAAPAVATATAAPILIKIAQFLSNLGINTEEVLEVGKRVLAKQVKNVVEKNLENQESMDQAAANEVDEIVRRAEGIDQNGKPVINYLPFVIGGALVLYFVTRKK